MSLIEPPLHFQKKSNSKFHHFLKWETQGLHFIGFSNVLWRIGCHEKLSVAFKVKGQIPDFKIFKSNFKQAMENLDHLFLKRIDLNKKKSSDLKGSYKAKMDERFNFSEFHWHMFSHEGWLIIQIQGSDWLSEVEYEDYKKFIHEAGDFAKSFVNL